MKGQQMRLQSCQSKTVETTDFSYTRKWRKVTVLTFCVVRLSSVEIVGYAEIIGQLFAK